LRGAVTLSSMPLTDFGRRHSEAPSALPRLLRGAGEREMHRLDQHLAVHGALPEWRRSAPGEIIDAVDAAGLRGHGGAAFPTGRKLRSVAGGRGEKVVVVNGTEGEPASKKDRVLLRQFPHLVLDGAAVAARAVGARRVTLAVCESTPATAQAVRIALAERRAAPAGGDEPRFELAFTPDGYISGQETALVSYLSGARAIPTFGPRPYQRGLAGRPTLVQNVETLAHVALIARHGPGWFREIGPAEHPGSALVTVSGAVRAPGVYEIDHGMPVPELLEAAGAGPARAVLVGGYFGTWIADDRLTHARLSAPHLRPHGASLGAGVLAVLGTEACPVAETVRIADFFLLESAGQCGPCVHGLAAIADTIQQLASATAESAAYRNLERWLSELPGRGACQHPDGAVRFISSAMQTFAAEFAAHASGGPCSRCAAPPTLPTPARSDLARAA
jgi:NADH:ubiquinone oxidoreductase subunit F (NADH-binding)